MPVTVTSSEPQKVVVLRQQPVTDIGGESSDAITEAFEDFDLRSVPGLSGGKKTPYQLSKNQSWWDKYLSWFGDAFDMSDVDTFNYASVENAKRWGIGSENYEQWTRNIIGQWYSEGGTSPEEIRKEAKEWALTDFLSALTDLQTWVRVGEGIVGISFLVFGLVLLAKELGVSPPIPTAKLASVASGGKV